MFKMILKMRGSIGNCIERSKVATEDRVCCCIWHRIVPALNLYKNEMFLKLHVFFIYCCMIYMHAYIVYVKIRQLIVPGIAGNINRIIRKRLIGVQTYWVYCNVFGRVERPLKIFSCCWKTDLFNYIMNCEMKATWDRGIWENVNSEKKNIKSMFDFYLIFFFSCLHLQIKL